MSTPAEQAVAISTEYDVAVISHHAGNESTRPQQIPAAIKVFENFQYRIALHEGLTILDQDHGIRVL